MSSCIYILDEDLEPLISKNIKSIPNLHAVIRLFQEVYTPTSPPIVINSNWYFVHAKRGSLIFLSAVHFYDENANVMSIAVYIDRFYLLLKKYLGVTELDRAIVLDNVLLILELLDESMDFGIAQMTEPGVMKDYIRVKVNKPGALRDDSDEDSSEGELERPTEREPQDNKKVKKSNRQSFYGFLQKTTQTAFSKKGRSDDVEEEKEEEMPDLYINSYIANTTIMPVSWRAKGIHYGKNEFFLDVVEKVQYLADFREGIVRKNLIHGKIHCKSYLSGMPKLKVALNKLLQQDAQFMAHSKFHHCVAVESLNEKELEFIPPDGDFVLCEYELKRHVNDIPMLKITSFEIKPKLKKFKVQIALRLESNFKSRNFTSILNVKVPLKLLFNQYQIDLSKPARFKSDSGQVLFNLSDDFLLWEIGQMRGGHGETQLAMTAEFSLFNKEEYEREQEERKHSMNPPPLREGPKLEELYAHTHSQKDSEAVVESIESQLVSMNFEIPYITCSGLKVEYLKIDEEQLQYQSFPWVRYKTVSDEEYAYLI